LLIASPLPKKHRRVTAESSRVRNLFVAQLAGAVFVAYAAAGGRTEQLCRDLIAGGKKVFTLDTSESARADRRRRECVFD